MYIPVYVYSPGARGGHPVCGVREPQRAGEWLVRRGDRHLEHQLGTGVAPPRSEVEESPQVKGQVHRHQQRGQLCREIYHSTAL